MRYAVLALTAVLALPTAAFAADIEASHPWIRAPVPGAMSAAGYVVLTNRGAAADRLLGASSPVAKSVGVHQSMEMSGVMHMMPVKALSLAPKGSVTFAPGGYHLMLTGLKSPLKAGGSAPITLQFEKAGPVIVQFAVEQPGAAPAAGDAMGDMHKH
jgi:copper(I)-binding protein